MGIERQGYIKGNNYMICQNRRSGFVYITSKGYGRWRVRLPTSLWCFHVPTCNAVLGTSYRLLTARHVLVWAHRRFSEQA